MVFLKQQGNNYVSGRTEVNKERVATVGWWGLHICLNRELLVFISQPSSGITFNFLVGSS